MVANRIEGGKPEAARGGESPETPPGGEGARPASGGGLKAWLPLLIAVTVLPVAAYVLTMFVLLPKLQAGLGINPSSSGAAKSSGHGTASAKEAEGGHGGGHGAAAAEGSTPGGQDQVPLTKLIVNVAGTSASRILLSSLIVVGNTPDFRTAMKDRDAQLRDTACGILGTKSIQDLEKPGARNIIRSELITAFNHVLGGNAVQEIYFTEFAVQ